MSKQLSNEAFRANMISEINSIRKSLNLLKTRKPSIVKKSAKRKTAKRKMSRLR